MLKLSRMAAALALALCTAFTAVQAEEVTVKQGDTTLRGELALADGKTAKDGVILKVETVDGADHFFLDLYADELADKVAGFVAW